MKPLGWSAAIIALTVGGLLVALAPAAVAAPTAPGTSYTWVGTGAYGAWGDATNWSPAGVPGAGDHVLVQAPSDTTCRARVTNVPAGTTVADLTVDEYLSHGRPDQPCPTSLGGGSLTVTHALTFRAGTISTALTVAAGATGTVTPGAALDAPHLGAGGLTVAGTLTLSGLTGDESFVLTGSPGITVAAGGTLATIGDNRVTADCCTSTAHLVNHGTVQLGTGTLRVDGVELDQDAVLTGNGGRVVTSSAPQTAGPGAQLTARASWIMGHDSDITITGPQTVAYAARWYLGGDGVAGGETLHGDFRLAGQGWFVWNGGTIAASVSVGPQILFASSADVATDPHVLSGRDGAAAVSIVNHGQLQLPTYHGVSGALVDNEADGRVYIGDGTVITADCCTLPSRIVNRGSLTSGTATVDDTRYEIDGGTTTGHLTLTGDAGGSFTDATLGGIVVATAVTLAGTERGGSLELAEGGTLTAKSPGVTISGQGGFVWSGGTMTGNITFTNYGQDFTGPDPKTVTAPAGGGRSTVVVNSTGYTRVLAGSAAAPTTVSTGPRATLTLGAMSTVLEANTALHGAITVVGGLSVEAGTGTASVTEGARLATSRQAYVQTGTLVTDTGILVTNGTFSVFPNGRVQLPSSARIVVQGGSLEGSGTIDGSVVVGAATLTSGSLGGRGTLTIAGSLVTAATSTVELALAADGSDRIVVGGVATLRGTLRLDDVDTFTPAPGLTVTVVTAASVGARFSCVTTTGNADRRHWVPTVSGSGLVLVTRVGAAGAC